MKIKFKNKDNLMLVGILNKPKTRTKTCIILCHGAAVDKDELGVFIELANWLVKSGFAAFRFDYRGHGESEGNSVDTTINGQKRDLESVLNLLTIKGYEQFGMVAASFSGIVVSFFVPPNQNKIKALIYWNSVLDQQSILKRWFPKNERKELMTKGYTLRHNKKYGVKLMKELSRIEPLKELRKIKIPVIFIHGEKDSTIPYNDIVRFAKIINSKVEVIHGSEHGFHTNKHSKQAAKVATSFFLENLEK